MGDQESKSEEVSEDVGEFVGKGVKKGAEIIASFAKGLGKGIMEDEENEFQDSGGTEKKGTDVDDPIHVLKLRYAKGEISKEKYDEMKKILEG
jgi:hypothetical protein